MYQRNDSKVGYKLVYKEGNVKEDHFHTVFVPPQGGGMEIYMKIQDVPFCCVDWSTITPVVHNGITGEAYWKTFEMGNIRVRMVEYTPGYMADHWCSRGHVILVLEGELITELSDGRTFISTPGVSYQVADEANPHRSRTTTGVKLFIVD